MPSSLRLSTPVAPGIFAIAVAVPYPFKYVNCYLLKGEGAVLVDCGLDTPEAKATLEAALAEHGLAYRDLDRLVVTHHHPDHYGLAGVIEAQGPGVWMLDIELQRGQVFWTQEPQMNQQAQVLFEQHGLGPEQLSNLLVENRLTRSRVHPAQQHRSFSDGEVLELAGMRFRAIWTPGHADGHAMLLREADGVLLAGDQIMERISPNIGVWAYTFPNPLAHFLESLDKTAALEAHLALPGHYRPLSHIAQRAAELKAHHHERLGYLLQLLQKGPQSCWELSLGLFAGDLNPTQRRFAWSETLAHLEYLVASGQIKKSPEGPFIYYLHA